MHTVFISIVIDYANRKADVNISSRGKSLNMYQISQVAKLASCLSKPYYSRIALVETGITVLEMYQMNPSHAPLHPEHASFINDLAAIQCRTKIPLILPDRLLTESEEEIIDKLRLILHEGQVPGYWSNFAISVLAAGVGEQLEAFCNGQANSFFFSTPATETLFETTLPLGVMTVRLQNAILANEAEVRAAYESRSGDDELIELHFIPGSDNRAIMTYADWLPTEKVQRGDLDSKPSDG
jgi:hypothetical protein